MSYSAVEEPIPPDCGSGAPAPLPRIETRLAASDDRGRTWKDVLLVNDADLVCLPAPANGGVWVNEVSTLARDPSAPKATRWKLLWHRYLWIRDGSPSNRRFDQGWIGLREAPSPVALARARERKLFVGAGYDSANDASSGRPELRLDRLHPDLARCAAFTEPGALGTSGSVYVALSCHSPGGQKLVLLSHERRWRYIGTIATRLTAPELSRAGGRTYLLATPEAGGRYLGCRGYELDLRSGRIGRSLFALAGVPGSFNGACGWDPWSTASGVLLGQVTRERIFTIVRTGRRLP